MFENIEIANIIKNPLAILASTNSLLTMVDSNRKAVRPASPKDKYEKQRQRWKKLTAFHFSKHSRISHLQ